MTKCDGRRERCGACDGPGHTEGDSSVTNAGDDRLEKCVRCVSVPRASAIVSAAITQRGREGEGLAGSFDAFMDRATGWLCI